MLENSHDLNVAIFFLRKWFHIVHTFSMKYFLTLSFLILSLISSLSVNAKIRVMTFNATCDFCSKGKFDKYRKRKHWILDTIKRNNPDIFALQEVRTIRQMKWFRDKLKDYDLYYPKFKIFRFSDPGIFVRKGRFKFLRTDGFWLGPKGKRKFTLGWKLAIPRRVQWVHLIDLQDKRSFIFVSGHFDNRAKNKEPSAQMVVDEFEHSLTPVIFAGDTNLKPATNGFSTLMGSFEDSFEIKEEFSLIRNSETNEDDSCNLEKGKTFPACRVDHILLSQNTRWRVLNWGVDQYKYGKKNRFTSDHRAVFADIVFE